jgi:hypothetical protein
MCANPKAYDVSDADLRRRAERIAKSEVKFVEYKVNQRRGRYINE